MAYLVTLKRSAEKELSRLSSEVHDRVVERLIALQGEPRPQGTKNYVAGKAIAYALAIIGFCMS